jgi:lipopolysaccharide export system protein LptA
MDAPDIVTKLSLMGEVDGRPAWSLHADEAVVRRGEHALLSHVHMRFPRGLVAAGAIALLGLASPAGATVPPAAKAGTGTAKSMAGTTAGAAPTGATAAGAGTSAATATTTPPGAPAMTTTAARPGAPAATTTAAMPGTPATTASPAVASAATATATAAALPMEISADRLEVDHKSSLATFSGHVVAVRGDLTLRCDRVEAAYDAAGALRSVVASGTVTLESKRLHATADRADYREAEHAVVLEGTLRITDGKSVLTGERARLLLDEERFVLEKARGTLVFAPPAPHAPPAPPPVPARSK